MANDRLAKIRAKRLGAYATGDHRWAATSVDLVHGRAVETVSTAQRRRWLLLRTQPPSCVHDALVNSWRDGHDIRELLGETPVPISEGGSVDLYASCAQLELGPDWAIYRWVGMQRVLRIRDGEVEQLTTDHDMLSVLGKQEVEAAAELPPHFRYVATAALQAGDLSEGSCDSRYDDRFVLLSARAHDRLQEAFGDDLGSILTDNSPHDAAMWAGCVLQEAGELTDVVLFVDANAFVRPDESDAPIALRCVSSDARDWILGPAKTRPWRWDMAVSRGVAEQSAKNALLSEQPRPDEVLKIQGYGAFQWRGEEWHDVRVMGHLEARLQGSISLPPSRKLHDVTEADLRDRPADFDGSLVRVRGLFDCGPERRSFAGAWLNTATRYEYGHWLVEALGTWHCSSSGQHGHMGSFPAELKGDAQLVSLRDLPHETIETLQSAGFYEPFIVVATPHRTERGWCVGDWLLMKLGGDHVPAPELMETPMQLTLVRVQDDERLGCLGAEPATDET